MSVLKQFSFPDVGEGLTEGEILKWLVKPGDEVTDGQLIVEVETAKAAVELPCPFDGVVTALHAEEGATVDVGAPILTVDVEPIDVEPSGAVTPQRSLTSDLVPEQPAAEEEKHSVLVGSGVKPSRTVRRARRTSTPAVKPAPAKAPAATKPAPAPVAATNGVAQPTVLATPPVRKLAKDHGIDLGTVTGTGPNGTITRADVEAAAEIQPEPSVTGVSGVEERIPVKGVRRQTAQAMVTSAFTAPHVTEFLAVDMTSTMELRDRVAASRQFDGVKVSPLLFVAKALLLAVRRHPMVNSTWDEENQEIIVKPYVNLGIAAATDRGLIVPNIKNAESLSLRGLADALADLVSTARAGKTPPADLARGTISITNVGVYGVDTGTPILPPGESAILAFGAVKPTPWVVDGEIVPRQVCQLALSFDHRIIDGRLGSEFLADIGAILSDPGMALVLG